MLMNFVALDFETANSIRSSICSIGLAIVENGKIIETEHILVKPMPNFYDGYNSSLHGISNKDTKNKKTFKQQWENLEPYFQNKSIVAHNASFDCSVLRYALDIGNLQYPDLEYYCTMLLSKAILNVPTHTLDYIAQYFKIKLKHHQAESDAKACALIALKLCEINKVDTLEQLSTNLGFYVGKIIGETKSYQKFSKSKPPPNPTCKRINKLSGMLFNKEKEALRQLYLNKKITEELYLKAFKKLREENPGHLQIIRYN